MLCWGWSYESLLVRTSMPDCASNTAAAGFAADRTELRRGGHGFPAHRGRECKEISEKQGICEVQARWSKVPVRCPRAVRAMVTACVCVCVSASVACGVRACGACETRSSRSSRRGCGLSALLQLSVPGRRLPRSVQHPMHRPRALSSEGDQTLAHRRRRRRLPAHPHARSGRADCRRVCFGVAGKWATGRPCGRRHLMSSRVARRLGACSGMAWRNQEMAHTVDHTALRI